MNYILGGAVFFPDDVHIRDDQGLAYSEQPLREVLPGRFQASLQTKNSRHACLRLLRNQENQRETCG
jgi:hypothetical protein